MSPTGTATQDFAFEGNHTASATPSFATITTPDGVVHNETPHGGIACIGVNQVANPTVGAPYPCTNQVSSQDLNETTYTVNFADASGGFFFFFDNVVNAHLHQLATDSTTGQAQQEVAVPIVATTLTKTPSASLVENNTAVTYTYNETNTGQSAIFNVNVTDNSCSPVTTGSNTAELDPGQSIIFTCTTTLTQNTTNTATAQALDLSGITRNETAQAFVQVIHPSISLTKVANATCILNGTAVEYTYNVTNTGDTTLNNVNVTDDKLGTIAGPITLAPGESQTFTSSAVLSQNTTNTATAKGVDVLGTQVQAQAQASVCVNNPPPFQVSTSASPQGNTTNPVSNPSDTITVTGQNGVNGTFSATATLVGPNGFSVAGTVTPASITGSSATFSVTTSGVSINGTGTYCWNVVVTDSSGNYSPATVSQNGTMSNNECFFVPPAKVFQGLTPGFWKNNAIQFGAHAWTPPYTPTTTFASAFGCTVPGQSSSLTLLQALQLQGGGNKALARQAVAALLDAALPDSVLNYPYTTAQVISMVCTAYASGPTAVNTLEQQLDTINNQESTNTISQHYQAW
jgi:hypothetical protein